MQFSVARAAIAIPVVTACALAAVSAAASAGQPAQLTGARLATALPTTAFHGYAVTSQADSGKKLETGQATLHPRLMPCDRFAAATEHAGFGETAFASDTYGKLFGGFGTASGQSFRQMVYQFATPHAAQFYFQQLRGVAGRCPGWRLQSTGGTDGGALAGTEQSPDGQALEITAGAGSAQAEALVVLNGADVIEVDATAFNRDVPAAPALGTLAHQLISRVHATR
jgi:hypothetical protein